MSQRGAGRNLDLVQQMPEPRKLTTIPRLALGLQMAAITFGNVHAVRTLPLVAFDMMLGEIRHRRINGFGRYEVLEQQLVTDVCLRARHGHHAVESKTQNVAFDFRHGTTGADEELVTVGLGPRTRRFCRLRHNIFSSASVPSISMNTSLLLVMSLSVICRTFPSQLTLTAPSRGGRREK